nr:hypothetical protein 12 [bacterium]
MGAIKRIISPPKVPAPVIVAPPPAPPEPPKKSSSSEPVSKSSTTVIQQETPLPQDSDYRIQQTRKKELRRRLLASQSADTLVTGGTGVTAAAPTAAKTLLGS